METRVTHKKGCVHISGEMTIHAAASLQQDLLAVLGRHRSASKLDLSEVSEFDTAGLQLLLSARRLAAAHGRELQLVEPSKSVHAALTLCQLSALLPTPAAERAG
jgi:anti-sigma B factor antagonist